MNSFQTLLESPCADFVCATVGSPREFKAGQTDKTEEEEYHATKDLIRNLIISDLSEG